MCFLDLAFRYTRHPNPVTVHLYREPEADRKNLNDEVGLT